MLLIISSLPRYYMMEDMESDYICSMTKDSGIHKCDSLPSSKSHDGLLCTDNYTSRFFDNLEWSGNNHSCIDWNQYYTECRAGDENPFLGAISFDNIGYAFIALFQVIIIELFLKNSN